MVEMSEKQTLMGQHLASEPVAKNPQAWLGIQHVDFEGLGIIAEVGREHGVRFDMARPYRGQALPTPEQLLERYQGLVVMGGPMGVYEAQEYPFLQQEQQLLAAAVGADRPVLGVCLGAQLMAAALGGSVSKGPMLEIGYGAVALTPEGENDAVVGGAGISHMPVLHWHQDTFELPAGAVHLARSGFYAHQAFRVGSRAYALQFHVEADEALLRDWAPHLPAYQAPDSEQRAALMANGRRVLGQFFTVALAG